MSLKYLQKFAISTPATLKLLGQMLVLTALGLQMYVLNGESRLDNLRAELEANTSRHAQLISLALEWGGADNPLLAAAIEVHQKRYNRFER